MSLDNGKVTAATLDLLISTYEGQQKNNIHNTDLFAALVELKALREEYKELNWMMEGLRK